MVFGGNAGLLHSLGGLLLLLLTVFPLMRYVFLGGEEAGDYISRVLLSRKM